MASKKKPAPATKAPPPRNRVYCQNKNSGKPEEWRAVWRGQLSPTIFPTASVAGAFLATCDYQKKLRY